MKRILVILAAVVAGAMLCSCIPVERYYIDKPGATASPDMVPEISPAPTPYAPTDTYTPTPGSTLTPGISPTGSEGPDATGTEGDEESPSPSSSEG